MRPQKQAHELRPGDRDEQSGEAVRLLLGVIPLLIVAGIIEAFVSPTGLAVSLKFAMAAALFVLLLLYLFWLPAKAETT